MNIRILNLSPKALGSLCLAVIIGILLAGLWPFNFWPANEVRWLKDRNGVHFYGQGIIFNTPEPGSSQSPLFPDGPITIELWLRPDSDTYPYLPRILSVYDGKESEVFFLGQWKSNFAVSTKDLEAKGGQYRNTGVENVLSKGEDRYVVINADEKGTRIYIDGKLRLFYPNYSLLPKDRKTLKQIILGNSPAGKGYWKGNIYGLAIYQRFLTAEQVSRHFQDWVNGKPPSFINGDKQSTISYFPFDERTGTQIQDQINHRLLLMHPGFDPPQKIILPPPWKDFRFNLSYFSDIVTNILGFIPFGFFLSIFLRSKSTSPRYPFIFVIFSGFFLSLAIELLQVFLPTRDSQCIDIITNTIGTSIGTVLFHVYYQSKSSQVHTLI